MGRCNLWLLCGFLLLYGMVISGTCEAFVTTRHRKIFSLNRLQFSERAIALRMTDIDVSSGAYPRANSLPIGEKKFHHLTVCIVPPESHVEVWEMVTKCRTELRDPGLFRWPPHANLLYPFLDIRPSRKEDDDVDNDDRPTVNPEIIEGLIAACRQCEPFHIRLQQFGTFGGGKRGVLWLGPDSYKADGGESTTLCVEAPLFRLQSLLIESFPTCNDQNKKTAEGFNPHMTLSHFVNLDEALAAQTRVEEWWPADLQFPVDFIYLLQRSGDGGQFLRVADISLGAESTAIVHGVPIPFRHMPKTEADWVLEERMKLKKRRNGKGRGGRSRYRSRSGPRIKDSPEVIEAKRIARKAKRDAANINDGSVHENAG
jgi:2'-5' RNA ligase superfamily